MEDPTDAKPESWDETEPMYIDDVTAEKPAEWDEAAPELIADESAEKPGVRLETGEDKCPGDSQSVVRTGTTRMMETGRRPCCAIRSVRQGVGPGSDPRSRTLTTR